jgi:hypothetical protein
MFEVSMTRAIASTRLALLILGLAGSAAFAQKPKVAILGVEAVDPTGGQVDPQSLEAARSLTEALRLRPRANPNPYVPAPNSDKELMDMKMLNNCDKEEPPCMATIGSSLNADFLIYGKIEKGSRENVKGYQAHLHLLDVNKKTHEREWRDFIPQSQSSSTEIQKWAKIAYAKLTGNSQGTLVVKVENPEVDKGTVSLDGKLVQPMSSGRATVNNVGEGKHRLVIEVGGFKRFDKEITVAPGETHSEGISLEPEEGKVVQPPPPPPCDPLTDLKCSKQGTVGDRGTTGWKVTAVVSGLATIGGFVSYLYGWSHLKQTGPSFKNDSMGRIMFDDMGRPVRDTGVFSAFAYGGYCQNNYDPSKTAHLGAYIDENGNMQTLDSDALKSCRHGTLYTGMAYTGAAVGLIGLGFTGFAIYKGFIAKTEHEPVNGLGGRSVRKSREISITPVFTPTGGGTVVRLEW